MSIAIRIILIIGALLTFGYIFNGVRKSNMSVADTVFWIFFGAILLLFAVFPAIAYFLAEIFGFIAPLNLVLVFVIAILIFKIFSMSMEIARLRKQLSQLAQKIGISAKRRDRMHSEDSGDRSIFR